MTTEPFETDEPTPTEQRSLAKGLLAGLIAGLVATAAKSVAERALPSMKHVGSTGESQPAASLSSSLEGDTQNPNWGFGAAIGALYGVAAEYFPAATDKDGASFGMALATLTQKGMLPAMGLSAEGDQPGGNSSMGEQAGEMASDVVFGVVTETVRKLVRRVL